MNHHHLSTLAEYERLRLQQQHEIARYEAATRFWDHFWTIALGAMAIAGWAFVGYLLP